MNYVLTFIKTKFVRYLLLIIVLIVLFAYTIPLIKKQHQLNKIQTQIEMVESKIEQNKQKWLNCDANMKLWNKDNNDNKKIVEELKTQYNNMVGFTSALQPQVATNTSK
jgi:septal ring factor EnvC (AmiA/AmiB activator)